MMSMKCKYAIKALVNLGRNYKNGCIHTADIASSENIPRKFLEQILLDLKHSKIVNSKQGSKGGYYLLKDPKDVTVADIYRIFDGPISLLPCVSLNYYEKCDDCDDEATCSLHREFAKIREGSRVVMSKTNLNSFLIDSSTN